MQTGGWPAAGGDGAHCVHAYNTYPLPTGIAVRFSNRLLFFELNTLWEQTGSVIKSFIIQPDELFRNFPTKYRSLSLSLYKTRYTVAINVYVNANTFGV